MPVLGNMLDILFINNHSELNMNEIETMILTSPIHAAGQNFTTQTSACVQCQLVPLICDVKKASGNLTVFVNTFILTYVNLYYMLLDDQVF